jgi:hypothetical protein
MAVDDPEIAEQALQQQQTASNQSANATSDVPVANTRQLVAEQNGQPNQSLQPVGDPAVDEVVTSVEGVISSESWAEQLNKTEATPQQDHQQHNPQETQPIIDQSVAATESLEVGSDQTAGTLDIGSIVSIQSNPPTPSRQKRQDDVDGQKVATPAMKRVQSTDGDPTQRKKTSPTTISGSRISGSRGRSDLRTGATHSRLPAMATAPSPGKLVKLGK